MPLEHVDYQLYVLIGSALSFFVSDYYIVRYHMIECDLESCKTME